MTLVTPLSPQALISSAVMLSSMAWATICHIVLDGLTSSAVMLSSMACAAICHIVLDGLTSLPAILSSMGPGPPSVVLS
jgi:hypothetical protein